MYVRLHSESSKPAICFLKRRPTNNLRRHRLADGQLSSPSPRLPSFSSFGAVSVMLCCFTPPAYSSAPLRSSVCYPSIGLVVNIIYIRTFCDHINVRHISDQSFIVFKSGWSSTSTTAQMPASSLVFTCFRLTPRECPVHR